MGVAMVWLSSSKNVGGACRWQSMEAVEGYKFGGKRALVTGAGKGKTREASVTYPCPGC